MSLLTILTSLSPVIFVGILLVIVKIILPKQFNRLILKFPYIKKDIRWALIIVAILFILVNNFHIGSLVLVRPEINNALFILTVFVWWGKRNAIAGKSSFILSLGRIFSLSAALGILYSLTFPFAWAFQIRSLNYLLTVLSHPNSSLFFLFAFIVYSLQYYIFTLWKKNYDFKVQNKLVFFEFAGLILVYLVGSYVRINL